MHSWFGGTTGTSRQLHLMPVAVKLRTLRWALNRASEVRPTVFATPQLKEPGLTEAICAIVMKETPLGDAAAGQAG